jgi:hypothetical protein
MNKFLGLFLGATLLSNFVALSTPSIVHAANCSDVDSYADSMSSSADDAVSQGNHLKAYSIYAKIATLEEECSPQDLAQQFQSADSNLSSDPKWRQEQKDADYFIVLMFWEKSAQEAKYLHDGRFCGAIKHEINAIEMTSAQLPQHDKNDARNCGFKI